MEEPNPDSLSMFVPLNAMTDTYDRLIDRIGILSEDQVQATMTAYLLLKQLPERLELLSKLHATEIEKQGGFAHLGSELYSAVAEIHKSYLEEIRLALEALSI